MEAAAEPSVSVWLVPCLITLFLYGLGQGFVKKWSEDVPPAQFCLFLIIARSIVNIGYFLYYFASEDRPALWTPEGMTFMLIGILVYILDGIGWVLYFESIVLGPITIVGTLSAAYPALTLLFARIFLNEQLLALQYGGVFMVIVGCLGLSYTPDSASTKVTNKRWIPLALTALACWGAAQTLLRYSYGLEMANEANMAFYGTLGGWLTLGMYGFFKREKKAEGTPASAPTPLMHSFLPMAMMAGGDLGVIVASSTGPASLVAPITGAYPLVTLIFAAIVLKEHIARYQWALLALLLVGIGFSTIPQPEETEPSAPIPVESVSPGVSAAPPAPDEGHPMSPSPSQ